MSKMGPWRSDCLIKEAVKAGFKVRENKNLYESQNFSHNIIPPKYSDQADECQTVNAAEYSIWSGLHCLLKLVFLNT